MDRSNSVPESLGFDLIHSGPGAWSCSSPRTRFGLDFRVSAMTEPNKDIRTNGQLPVGTVTMPQWFSSLYSAPLLPSPIPGPPQPPYPSQTPPLQTHTFYSTHSSGTLCSLGPSPTDWHGHKRGKLLSSRAASVFPDLLWDRAEWGPSCCTKPPAGHRTGGVMSSVVIGKGFVWSIFSGPPVKPWEKELHSYRAQLIKKQHCLLEENVRRSVGAKDLTAVGRRPWASKWECVILWLFGLFSHPMPQESGRPAQLCFWPVWLPATWHSRQIYLLSCKTACDLFSPVQRSKWAQRFLN